jgi:hypothetical protein
MCSKKKPKLKQWRTIPFPLYNNILFLVDGMVATGAGAFHAGGASQLQSTDAITQSTQSASELTPSASQEDSVPYEDTPATPHRSSLGPAGLNLPRGVCHPSVHRDTDLTLSSADT